MRHADFGGAADDDCDDYGAPPPAEEGEGGDRLRRAHRVTGRATGVLYTPRGGLDASVLFVLNEVRASHSHPFSRAHRSTSRWPHCDATRPTTSASHGHPYSHAPNTTPRGAPPWPRMCRSSPPAVGTRSRAPTEAPPGGLSPALGTPTTSSRPTVGTPFRRAHRQASRGRLRSPPPRTCVRPTGTPSDAPVSTPRVAVPRGAWAPGTSRARLPARTDRLATRPPRHRERRRLEPPELFHHRVEDLRGGGCRGRARGRWHRRETWRGWSRPSPSRAPRCDTTLRVERRVGRGRARGGSDARDPDETIFIGEIQNTKFP